MKSALRRRGLRITLTVAAVGAATLAAAGASAQAVVHTSSHSAKTCHVTSRGPVRAGHISGIVRAVAINPACRTPVHIYDDPAIGTPPLLFHGGSVMGTASTGPVVITPIYWNPAGHTMAAAYKNLITQYWTDVVAASGQHTNVYSTLNQYTGNNGTVSYNFTLGAPISDTGSLPASGCTVTRKDKRGIYADGTGYNACLDDAQLQAETTRIINANGLQVNLAHMYVLYLPKAVESCINPGSTLTSANQCTINHEPSATFCAYHSIEANGTVYGNLPFPIYTSSTGFTCGSEAKFPVNESPNGNVDGDVVISPSSHEVSESITDPDTVTGWFDSSGFENGDECNFVYGGTQGTAGALYNQVINGHHYLTQEEFSNSDFAVTHLGCLQFQ
jgi:hypothetical protein